MQAILNANNLQFRRQPAALDALGANPDVVKQVTTVLRKNPDELFMFATRPLGAPAGATFDSQGRLWIVEDRNRSLIVVAPAAAKP